MIGESKHFDICEDCECEAIKLLLAGLHQAQEREFYLELDILRLKEEVNKNAK